MASNRINSDMFEPTINSKHKASTSSSRIIKHSQLPSDKHSSKDSVSTYFIIINLAQWPQCAKEELDS